MIIRFFILSVYLIFSTPYVLSHTAVFPNIGKGSSDGILALSPVEPLGRRPRVKICHDYESCKNICENIYSRSSGRQDCEDLSVEEVEALEVLDEYLEKPDLYELQDIDSYDLEVYISVSIDPLDNHVSDWNKRETKAVLKWIAVDYDVARIFEEEDNDYEILKTMLNKISPLSDAVITKVKDVLKTILGDSYKVIEPILNEVASSLDAAIKLKESLKETVDGETLLEIAIVEDNEYFLEWIHGFIEDEAVGNCDADDLETAGCLELYCDLAYAMSDDDTAEEWPYYEYFEDYLDDVIDEAHNNPSSFDSPDWADGSHNDYIKDTRDLRSKWWEQLC